MIDNKTLINIGFIRKKIGIEEYGHTMMETRWYYGPYIYLTKSNKKYCVNWIDNNNEYPIYLKYFNEDEYSVDDVLRYCKDKYMDLNKKFIKEIEELQSKRDEIMNYVF